jgi:transcription factor IIIB subunit 2
MLIDFSDVLHASVYALGVTFMKLVRLLEIPRDQIPMVDPSLYMARFAAQLEFGDKTHSVTTDALRLVQRMKRDWIHYGL